MGIQILDVKIRDIEPSDYYDPECPNEREDVLFGTCEILGVEHHAVFIRVHTNEFGEQEPTNDPNDRYGEVCRLHECTSFRTVTVPDFEGEYVVLIHPFGF